MLRLLLMTSIIRSRFSSVMSAALKFNAFCSFESHRQMLEFYLARVEDIMRQNQNIVRSLPHHLTDIPVISAQSRPCHGQHRSRNWKPICLIFLWHCLSCVLWMSANNAMNKTNIQRVQCSSVMAFTRHYISAALKTG